MNKKISYLFVFAALILAIGCSDDDDNKESVNNELALYMTDSWAPESFYMDYGAENATLYEVCDAPDLYNNAAYKEGLELMSQFLLLEEDKNATLTPLCTAQGQVDYTWSAVKVTNGDHLKLVANDKTIRMRVVSYGGDDLVLTPLEYGLPETFVMNYKRAQ